MGIFKFVLSNFSPSSPRSEELEDVLNKEIFFGFITWNIFFLPYRTFIFNDDETNSPIQYLFKEKHIT